MLIPLRCDAPLHHRPWATGGIIATNFAVHVWAQGADANAVRPLILNYGEWVPSQWLTSAFLHQGWIHLLGNMLFLWVFGLVVEGKIGWWRFLALYGAIAVAAHAFEQTIMLGASGGSLGASGVIYGLVAIAAVWAPENEVECLFVIFPWVREVDVSIRTLAYLYVAWEVVGVVFSGFSFGSAVLHLIGAAAGLPLGILMLRRGWVDCEGWDWYSRRDYRPVPIGAASRRAGKRSTATMQAVSASGPARVHTAPPDLVPAPPAAQVFDELVGSDDFEGALRLHDSCSPAECATLAMPSRERLIHALVAADRDAEARPLITHVLRDDPGHPRVGLIEAGLLVRERRPSRAERVLASIAPRIEDDEQRRTHADLVERAESLRTAGVLELEE